jgi:hypothetical protein
VLTSLIKKGKEIEKIAATAELAKSFTGAQVNSNELVKSNAMEKDCELLQSQWKQSHSFRMYFVGQFNFAVIFDEYKACSLPYGISLVNWKKLQKVILKDTTTVSVKTRLKNNGTLRDVQKDILLVKGLHAVLYSGKKFSVKEDGRKKAVKLTMDNSMSFMITTCATENSVVTDIEEWKSMVNRLGLQAKPIIIVIGKEFEDIQSDSFIVIVNSFFYKFTSFLKALNALMKIYEVLKIPFPEPDKEVYEFIKCKFLGVSKVS